MKQINNHGSIFDVKQMLINFLQLIVKQFANIGNVQFAGSYLIIIKQVSVAGVRRPAATLGN